MKGIIGRTLFSTGIKEYSGKDVLLAAMIRNEWEPFENTVRKGIACVKASEENDNDFEEDVESAATKFRYEHNLVAADDLTSWLDEREIDVEEWLDYILRSMLISKWNHRLDEILAEFPVTDDELAQIIDCDAICSGAFSRFSYTLAGRAAVFLKKEDPVLRAEFEAQQIRILPGEIRQVDVDPTEVRQQMQLEEFFQWFSIWSLTEEKIRNHIRSHSMDWTRFHFRRLSFARQDSAQEAAWCVKEDGLDFEDVAKQSKTKIIDEVSYYDELNDFLKEYFLVAQKDSMIGPISMQDQFSLIWIVDRFAPTEQDPEITKKAQEDLLQRIVDREVTDKVRWHFRF